MASLLQLSFKLQCPAHHTGHCILASKGYIIDTVLWRHMNTFPMYQVSTFRWVQQVVLDLSYLFSTFVPDVTSILTAVTSSPKVH
jgi:hypothetical protein